MTNDLPNWADATGFAEAVFIARDTLETLSQKTEETLETAGLAVSFDDIYQFATDPDATAGSALALALATNDRVRADLHRLLCRTAPMRPMTRAAASSGAITTRLGSGFEMILRESRADRGQIYLIIRLGQFSHPSPTTLFVINEGAACRKVPLPVPTDGVIQMLLDVTSDLAASLCDPKTDVFLR